MNQDGALVLLSGGQDSATCLAWALERFGRVDTIGFSYGQRHIVEMSVREAVREEIASLKSEWRLRLGSDLVIDLSVLSSVSRSVLTGDGVYQSRQDGLPPTFVPGRNLVFLSFAAIVAEQRGLKFVVTGVCETDYSGYPDCRDDTVKALQAALNLGMQSRLAIETPLMWISKRQTWEMADHIGGPGLVEIIRTATHTCYAGVRDVLHDWGAGCGTCDACKLRAKGWTEFAALKDST